MTNRATVEARAKELAEWEQNVAFYGMANVNGLTPEQAVEQAARLRIARDRADVARHAYNRAFEVWRMNDFRD